MEKDPANDAPRGERVVRHPIHAAAEEAEHARDVVQEGKSAATPAIMVGAVLVVIVTLAATYMVVAFTVYHFA